MVRRKSARSKKKSSSIVKKIMRFFMVVVGMLIVFSLFVFSLFLIVKPKYYHKNILLIPDKKSGVEEQIILAEFYQNPPRVTIIALDQNSKSTLIGGYGEYQLKSVEGILEIDQKASGFIKAAFSHFLQKGIDEVYTGSFSFPSNKTETMKLFLSNRETFLTGLAIKDIPDENITYLEFESKEDWEKYLGQQLTWRINSDCTVAVVNATDQSGLASKFSQILENSGVEVVRSTNNIWGDTKTHLYVDDQETCEVVKKRVKSISPIDLQEEVDTTITAQYRATMVLFIGEELAEIFTE